MIKGDLLFQAVCIFGYSKYGEQLYDSIKKTNESVHCIYCDNDINKHRDDNIAVVAPTAAVDLVKSKALDAIIIPESYTPFTLNAMVFQLSLLGVDADSVFIARKDSFGGDINFNQGSLIDLAEIHVRDFLVGTQYNICNLKDLFIQAQEIHSDVKSEIDILIAENNIDGKSRTLVYYSTLFGGWNTGDTWYFLSRIPAYERINNCRLVILIDSREHDALFQRSRFLEHNGFTFEFLRVDLPIIASATRSRSSNAAIMMRRFLEIFETTHFCVFYVWKMTRFSEFFRNTNIANQGSVRRPRFPEFNKQHYIDTYGINPGKTFWIIPESNWIKPFPLSYWNAVAAILKNIGFTVVFNSKDPACNGTLAFLPWEDVVGFAELCGHVIGTRTGFFDFAIIANANFYIFTPPLPMEARVEDVFGVDNSDGHIRTIPIHGTKDFSNLDEFRYFGSIRRNFIEYIYDLSCDKEKYIIFIASKFTHCQPSNSDANRKSGILTLLDLKFDFSSTYGWSYCAVIDSGNVIAESYSTDKRVRLSYVFDEGKHKADVISEGCNVDIEHCQASVIIDGVESCMNKQGLNIVLWDKDNGKIKESVVFNMLNDSPVFETDTLISIARGWTNI